MIKEKVRGENCKRFDISLQSRLNYSRYDSGLNAEDELRDAPLQN